MRINVSNVHCTMYTYSIITYLVSRYCTVNFKLVNICTKDERDEENLKIR